MNKRHVGYNNVISILPNITFMCISLCLIYLKYIKILSLDLRHE